MWQSEVVRIKSIANEYQSFRVVIQREQIERAFSQAEKWPKGIYVRKNYFPRKRDIVNTKYENGNVDVEITHRQNNYTRLNNNENRRIEHDVNNEQQQ